MYAIQANCPDVKGDIQHLGRIQGAVTTLVEVLRSLWNQNVTMSQKVTLNAFFKTVYHVVYKCLEVKAQQLKQRKP